VDVAGVSPAKKGHVRSNSAASGQDMLCNENCSTTEKSHYSCEETETHVKLDEEAEREILKFQKFAKKFFERRGQLALYCKFFPE
jgi:hypothetical protein